MGNSNDYIELVQQAQLGNDESLNRLAELARARLCVYVYRLVLADDLVQDIVQESMLEMFKVLGKLKRADRFWPWLYGIALNKVHRHHRTVRHQRAVSMSETGYGDVRKGKQEGLEKLVSQELKQIVSAAMRELKVRHRAILTMRCYDEMAYSDIAESMGCSEFGARMLFYRAKKSLQKQLSRKGLGRSSLLAALVIFGKMTAPTEAAAAQISITSATTSVGLAAGFVGIVTSKTAVVSLTTAGVLAVGTVVAPPGDGNKAVVSDGESVRSLQADQSAHAGEGGQESWYFYPKGIDGPMMMRLVRYGAPGKYSYCQMLQDEQGNYYFDKNRNTISVRNCRMWRSDLTVRRLPTDRANLREFLSTVEGRTEQMDYVGHDVDGLLVILKQDGENGNRSHVIHHYKVLDEEYFRYDWPRGAKIVDNRDRMHRRGWTYFKVSGQIGQERVSGAGRIPFVYAASGRYAAWLKMRVGDDLRIVDNGAEALVYGSGGAVVAKYKGGSFFKGFARPWMGLHTIDTVRRDAAEKRIRFETRLLPDGDKAEVVLNTEQDKIIYTIDMETDVINKITFSGRTEGELRFSYLQDIGDVGGEFAEPGRRSYIGQRRQGPGVLWLLRLAEGQW